MSEKTLKLNQKLFYDMGPRRTMRVLTLPDGIRISATTIWTSLEIHRQEDGALIIKVKSSL